MTILYSNINSENNIFNVLNYGAIGDGVTDDTLAIQAAIDAVPSNGGGIVLLPGKFKITSTISISGKPGLIVRGSKIPVVPGSLSTGYPGSIIWGGALNGTMITLENPVQLALENIELRGSGNGPSGAAIGLYITQQNTGWGVCDFKNIGIDWCTQTPVVIEGLVDGGRNFWHRCSFWNRHNTTGSANYDSIILYRNCSNVVDHWQKCEFIYDDGLGNKPSGSYSIYVSGGSPDIFMTDCYTRSHMGIVAHPGSAPYFTLLQHYSEDTNFLTLPSINSRQTLISCNHVSTHGGYSIRASGAGTAGKALTIDGGQYIGSVNILSRGPVVISNNPTFTGGISFVDSRDIIRIGRHGNYSNTSVGAINAQSFIPAIAAAQTATNIFPNLYIGQILPIGPLTNNTTILAPSGVDNSWDIGREFEFHITGNNSNNYTVNFNSVFKLSEGSYVHSGSGKLDILTFRYNGTSWVETSRSMNITP